MRFDSPLVSVIMPVYNCEKFVTAAIDSIISQTYPNWELLIFDDCSRDNTFEIVKAYTNGNDRIRIFKGDENRGAAYCRNVLIREASGAFIALMDGDDLCTNNRIAHQVEYINENSLDGCGTNCELVDSVGQIIGQHKNLLSYQQILWSLYNNMSFCNASLVIKRDCLLSVGGYNEQLRTEAEDIALLGKLFKKGFRIETIESSHYYYRQHNSNVSIVLRRLQSENSFQITKNLIEDTLGKSCSKWFPDFMKYFHRPDFSVKGECAQLFSDLQALVLAIEEKILRKRIDDPVVKLDIARKMLFLALNERHQNKLLSARMFLSCLLFYPSIAFRIFTR